MFSFAHVYEFTLLCSLSICGCQTVETNKKKTHLDIHQTQKNTLRMPKSRGRHRRGKSGRIWQLYVSLRLRICSGISKTELISLLYCKHEDKGFCNKLKIKGEGLEHGLQRRGTITVFQDGVRNHLPDWLRE